MVKENGQLTNNDDFSKAEGRKHFFRNLFGNRVFSIVLVLAAFIIILSSLNPNFSSISNMLNIMRQMSLITIASVGVTIVMITGEIDISVGSQMGLYAIILGLLILEGVNPWVAFLIALLVGLIVGFVNGFLVTKIGAPSFIATLGMLNLLRGLSLVFSRGWPVMGFDRESKFLFVMGGLLFNGKLPVQALWMLGVILVGGIVLARTVFGQHLYATGGNKIAAKFAGIDVDRTKIAAFMVSGACCAVAGAVMLGFMKSADPLGGSGMELNAIIATVIGGTSMFGGSGTIIGTFIGSAILGVIRNGLIILGISAYWQEFAIGAVVIGAITIDLLIRRRTRD